MPAEDPPSPFTEEHVAQIKQLVVGMVNSALRSHTQMADKKRQEDRDAIKADFAKLLDEKLGAARPKDGDGGGGDKDGAGGGKRQALELELSTMKRSQAEMQQRIETAERERKAAAEKLKATERKERLATIFASLGLEGQRFQAAYPHLLEHVRPQSDEEGAPDMWVDESGEVELSAGAKAWAKSDFAKLFLPPTHAAGSGARKVPAAVGRPGDQKKSVTFEDVGNAVLDLVSPMGAISRVGE